MAVKLLFPADRTAFQYGAPGEPIRTPQITALVIYVDESCTTLADIFVPGNGRIANSTIYTDETGLLPEFLGPLGVTRLWALVQVAGAGTAPYPLDAAFGPRIDDLIDTIAIPGGSGFNTIRNGDGAPAANLGIDGDWYIDKTAKAIYGPKNGDSWGSPTSLVGPAGQNGTGGSGGTSYTHNQYSSADTWDIVHGLGYVPSVNVVDSAGSQVYGDVRILSTNHLQTLFSSPFSGTAFLS